jgi:hypothetical protein
MAAAKNFGAFFGTGAFSRLLFEVAAFGFGFATTFVLYPSPWMTLASPSGEVCFGSYAIVTRSLS